MKRVLIDGEYYRFRRGKLVKIPKKWINKIPTPTTISERASKQGQGRRHKRLKVMRQKRKKER